MQIDFGLFFRDYKLCQFDIVHSQVIEFQFMFPKKLSCGVNADTKSAAECCDMYFCYEGMSASSHGVGSDTYMDSCISFLEGKGAWLVAQRVRIACP